MVGGRQWVEWGGVGCSGHEYHKVQCSARGMPEQCVRDHHACTPKPDGSDAAAHASLQAAALLCRAHLPMRASSKLAPVRLAPAKVVPAGRQPAMGIGHA